MIGSGDRVLVCLSGGKDSLSLLHTLKQYQHYAKAQEIEFSLGAVTVDPGSEAYDPSTPIPYLKEFNVTYLDQKQGCERNFFSSDILRQALAVSPESVCGFCSRMKRGRLYAAAARKHDFNVLAFGQHLYDLTESLATENLGSGSGWVKFRVDLAKNGSGKHW